MNRPDVLVSYSQNHEDIVLARVLEPWNRIGHWIDLGAGHPIFESVSKLFSNFGWTGINVEPLPQMWQLLQEDRPLDINLNVAVGESRRRQLLFPGPSGSEGTATLRPEFLEQTQMKPGSGTPAFEVEVIHLADVLALSQGSIDFLKIDVEGLESEIINSFDWHSSDINIIVVESTLPNSTTPSHHDWEPELISAGYEMFLFDGLNRFFRHNGRCGSVLISRPIWHPATVQDAYIPLREMIESQRVVGLRTEVDALLTERESLRFELSEQRRAGVLTEEYANSLERELKKTKSEFAKLQVEYVSSAAALFQTRQTVQDLTIEYGQLKRRLEDICEGTVSLFSRVASNVKLNVISKFLRRK